jgi:hypothetical protein
LDASDRALQDAVDASSFERMRSLENERGRPGHSGVKNFMRSGQSRVWPAYFDEDALRLFREREGDALARLGYDEPEALPGREIP